MIKIHILVALFFVNGRTEEKYVPDHIDSNKINNMWINLQWVTVSENAFKSKLNRIPVNKLDARTGKIIESFNSLADAARSVGKNRVGDIVNVCKGINKTAYGYKWEYANKHG